LTPFPVAFEILGMLGKTLHASASGFRMLPNPTIYHWDRKSFSMWKLLVAYREKIEESSDIPKNEQMTQIKNDLDLILKPRQVGQSKKSIHSIARLDTLHQALDNTDRYLTQRVQEYMVHGILRGHYQAVLGQLSKAGDQGLFEELSTATPEERQARFIDIYFSSIRLDAVQQAPKRKFTINNNNNGGALGSHEARSDDALSFDARSHSDPEGDDDKLNTIWCTVVFRMICWLQLHDFHKNDIQISKSELLGSRLPVYIG
jgi:hypothetical protein